MTDPEDIFRKLNEMEAYLLIRKYKRLQLQRRLLMLLFCGSLALFAVVNYYIGV